MAAKARVETIEATEPPSDAEIAVMLGEAHQGFQALVRRGGATTGEWRRFNKKSPWVFKVSQGERALFYAQPDSGKVKVTVLLGGKAVVAALAGQVSKRLQVAIREAKAYPEGRPVSVWIKRPSDLAKVLELVAVKLAATASPGRRGRSQGSSAVDG